MTRHVLVLAACLAPAAAAHAQPAGAQAEVLFREGRDLMAKGKIAEACAAFDQSQKLDPATTTLLNLAGCREKNNQLATAWGLFLDAERQTRGSTNEATKKLHDVAQDRATKLEPRVSKLTITVAAKVDGLEIVRDQERIDPVMWNRALPVDGGTYTITAKAPGAQPFTTKVTVAAEKDAKTVEVPDLRAPKPVPATPATTQPPPTTTGARPVEPVDDDERPRPERKRIAVVPIVIASVSATVLLGTAFGFSLWGDATYDDAKAEIADQARRDELYSSANTKRYVAEGLAVAGIAAAGATVWLIVRGRGHAASTTAQRVRISPAGIAVVGRF